MKKLIAIFFLIVYTGTAIGAVINYHYCNGHLANTSFLSFGGKSDCACNPAAMPKNCCKDELLYIKTDNHKTVQESFAINTISFTPDLPSVSDLHNLVLQGENYGTDNFYNYIHRRSPHPIYLLNQVFRL